MRIRFDRKTGDFIIDLPLRWGSFLEHEKYLQQILLMIVITAMFIKYGVR